MSDLRAMAEDIVRITDIPNIVDNEERWYAVEQPARELALEYLRQNPPVNDEFPCGDFLVSLGFMQRQPDDYRIMVRSERSVDIGIQIDLQSQCGYLTQGRDLITLGRISKTRLQDLLHTLRRSIT